MEDTRDLHKLLRYEGRLDEIALAFRHSDATFPSLELEDKTFLNDAGKVLELVAGTLRVYRYSGEEEKLALRRLLHELRVQAEEMARGARKIFHTDIGISVTGIAGPSGGTPDKPVGTVCFAISAKDYENSKRINFGENNLRSTIKLRSSQAALDILRRYLMQL